MKEIPLTQGKVALVDDEDYERVSAYKWQANKGSAGYWYGHNDTHGQLHRFVVNAPRELMVDHKNGDGLDCRRENLRLATNAQNQYNAKLRVDNKSGFRGVHWDGNRWIAQIKSQGRPIYLGRFNTPEAAARAYDTKARELRGEFARTNF